MAKPSAGAQAGGTEGTAGSEGSEGADGADGADGVEVLIARFNKVQLHTCVPNLRPRRGRGGGRAS